MNKPTANEIRQLVNANQKVQRLLAELRAKYPGKPYNYFRGLMNEPQKT